LAFNPHARIAQNYRIVEDLAQAPSVMSALKVLQSFPTQRKALLKVIGGIDPDGHEINNFLLGISHSKVTNSTRIPNTSDFLRKKHL
jgi:hypothetical protein